MARRDGERRVEIGERLGGLAERGARGAAVDKRIAVARIARQDCIERAEGFLRPVERQQRIAAIKQCVGIVRAQRKRAVESGKRLVVALEPVQHNGEILPGIGRGGVDLERRRHQPVGLTHPPILRLAQAEQMQGVEMLAAPP